MSFSKALFMNREFLENFRLFDFELSKGRDVRDA